MVDENRSTGGDEDEAEAATQAFDALRKAIEKRGAATVAELKLIRKGVEALFDQVESLQARPDYAQDLAQLKQIGVVVAERLKALEAAPILNQGVQAFERAGSDLGRASAQTLEQKAQRFENAAFTLERITKGIHDRQRQWMHLAIAGAVCLLGGALLLLFLPRLLPFDVDTHVAAAVLGKPRWEAGATIMHAENPDAWRDIVRVATLRERNLDVLNRCHELARKKGATQKCSIWVAPEETSANEPSAEAR